MSTHNLTSFEKKIVAELAHRAGLSARLLETWSGLPDSSIQTVRSLIDAAQLGVTEEQAAYEVLGKAVKHGLLDELKEGFRPCNGVHSRFKRLAFALHVIEYYVDDIHHDATKASIVLTKPPSPSMLEKKLSEMGWRTSDIEPTEHAFHSIVRMAKNRVVVMTPFFDAKGARWLQELFSLLQPDVERILVLRSLEDSTRHDYPAGYDEIAAWLKSEGVKVFNYSIPRIERGGRETFHAKVLLCDRNVSYVGSSNMNAASLEHSMEMGILLQGKSSEDVAIIIDSVLMAAAPWA